MVRTLPWCTKPVMPSVAHLVWRWYRDSMNEIKKFMAGGRTSVTWLLLLEPALKGMAGEVGWKRCMSADEPRLALLHEVEFQGEAPPHEVRQACRPRSLSLCSVSLPWSDPLERWIPSPRLHPLPHRIHSRPSHWLDGWIDGDYPRPLYRSLG